MGLVRADTKRNRQRILDAAARLLSHSTSVSQSEIATAAGVSRSTLHRHFPDRQALIREVSAIEAAAAPAPAASAPEAPIDPGRLGRDRPVALDGIDVFDAVPPAMLAEQLIAEAQRVAEVPLGLYVLDIDGSHLLKAAGPDRLPASIRAPRAIGPELDADGLVGLREDLSDLPGAEIVPLWLRGRAIGVILTLGRPRRSLTEIARQAAAAVTLAEQYTDVFAAAQRRKTPRAAAEIQQSLLPPRISRVTGGEVAGNVLPSYEVAGDWFDVVENHDGVWISLADGIGENTRAAASGAVALGALRASRRSGGTPTEALLLMHHTLKEMPGPGAEMSALVARWDPASFELTVANCGHVAPIVLRNGDPQRAGKGGGRGLGGRSSPRPDEHTSTLGPGDRLVLFSDGVVKPGTGRAGLGMEGVVSAALTSETATAADTVRRIHHSVLAASADGLADDATVVCLAVQ
ncbi:SpoIIE family protein phosphatase [Thermoleophilia bacterium SCSIO 60948]|nr:SpoIIE family protein phosphatase [Thermoleophilia bacterium SCSIO 60948]